MKDKKINCFNCGKPGHFAHDYTEPKVLFNHNHHSNLYVSSCLMLAKSVPFWTVDSGATDHIAKGSNFLCGISSNSKGK